MKTGFELLLSLFNGPAMSGPSRKSHVRGSRGIGKAVSGNSKWHRRMLAAGKK